MSVVDDSTNVKRLFLLQLFVIISLLLLIQQMLAPTQHLPVVNLPLSLLVLLLLLFLVKSTRNGRNTSVRTAASPLMGSQVCRDM